MAIKQPVKRALLPSPGPRTLPLGLARGIRMHVDFSTLTHTYLGLYEIELNRFLRRALRPGVSAFDVGVQYGYDSLLFARRTHASVASFECDPGAFEIMRRNFALNPELVSLIEPVFGMVGDEPGQIGLDQWAYNGGFVPEFIKLDIDGGELDALRSARRLLSEHRPALLIETHSARLEQDCGRLLVAHGYAPVIVNPRRLLPDQRPLEHNRWLVAI